MKTNLDNLLRAVFMMIILGCFSLEIQSQTHIRTEADLLSIAEDLNGDYVLDNDIVLTEPWVPVGSTSDPFTGTFDGNGFTIKNLEISVTNVSNIGFFSVVDKATIKNAGFFDVRVVASYVVSDSESVDVAAIVGTLKGSIVENCWSSGYIEGRDHVASIVGGTQTSNDGTGSVIENCYAYAHIYSREYQAGGILGTAVEVAVKNCLFVGRVECERANSGSSNTGGIIALIDKDNTLNSITSSVCIATELIGAPSATTGRILGKLGGDQRRCDLQNNYAYEGTLVNGKIINPEDPQATTEGFQGAGSAFSELQSVEFYTHSLGWDFDVWHLTDGVGFPVFRHQSLSAPFAFNKILHVSPEDKELVFEVGKTYQLSPKTLIPGTVLHYSSSNPAFVSIDENGLLECLAEGDVTISVYTEATDFLQKAEAVVNVSAINTVKREIETAEELYNIRYAPEATFTLMNDIDLKGTDYEEWKPIPEFTGIFDGNGHVIRNFSIYKPESNNVGFFSRTTDAVIKKVGIEGAHVVGGNPNNSSTGADVGVLIGRAVSTEVAECYVSLSYVEGRDHVASIIGGSDNGNTHTIIRNCYASAIVYSRVYQAGGILGAAKTTDVENCYFSGTVETPNSNTGGIVSYLDDSATIVNCVVLSPYLKGSRCDRILGNHNKKVYTLTNNFARADLRRGKGDYSSLSPIPNDDPNIGAHLIHGANIAANLADDNELELYYGYAARSEYFYTDMMGWDTEQVWRVDDETESNPGSYPVLAWQKTPVATSIFAWDSDQKDLLMGETERGIAFGAHGQDVVYSSSDLSVIYPVLDGNFVSFLTGEDGMKAGTAQAIASVEATGLLEPHSVSYDIRVLDPDDIDFNVGDATEFNAIRNNLYGTYTLVNDIDLSEFENFEPIGTSDKPFRGKLIGDKHVISNLTINRPDGKGVAIFGYAENATFRDLALLNVDVLGKVDAGGLVGSATGTTFERIYVGGKIQGDDHAGSIGGGTKKNAETSYLKDCYSDASVYSRVQSGGLLGVASNTYISNSYFSGDVSAATGSNTDRAAGIVTLLEDTYVSIENVVSLAKEIYSGRSGIFYTGFSSGVDNVLLSYNNNYTYEGIPVTSIISDGVMPDADAYLPIETFRTQDFYAQNLGWNFEDVWTIEEGVGYPTLKGQRTSSIAEPKADTQAFPFSVYADGSIVFSSSFACHVSVYNLSGQLLYNEFVNEEASFDVPVGVYIVKVIVNGEVYSLKVVNK